MSSTPEVKSEAPESVSVDSNTYHRGSGSNQIGLCGTVWHGVWEDTC